MSDSFKCADCEIKDKAIDVLEEALAETFRKVVEIFGAFAKDVETELPERAAYFNACIQTLKKVIADHEKSKGLKNETKH